MRIALRNWLRHHAGEAGAVFLLTAGSVLFAGAEATAMLLALLLLGNRLLGRLLKPVPWPVTSLEGFILRSLLNLGLFPFLWLTLTLVFKGRSAYWTAGLLVLVNLLLVKKREPIQSQLKTPGGLLLSASLLLALLVLLTYLPFSRIGRPSDDGSAYRAYFSSDYLKHFSMVETLNRGKLPPQNPYFASDRLHYYWLPYAFPAAVARWTGKTDRALIAYSFSVNFLFLLLLFSFLRRILTRGTLLPLLLTALVFFPSLEGLYFFLTRCRASPAAFFTLGRQINIDALTRWNWNLPEIDSLLRSLLYTPQHLLSLCFVILVIFFNHQRLKQPLFFSLLLALALANSFFIGGILLLAWGAAYLINDVPLTIPGESRVKKAAGALASLSLPALVAALSLALGMVSIGGSRLLIKPVPLPGLPAMLGLNLGLLFVFGLLGMARARFPGKRFQACLFIIALGLTLLLRAADFESDISLKAGLIIIVQLVLFTAFGLAGRKSPRWLPVCFILLALAAGSMTGALDVLNSADTDNRRQTLLVSRDEMAMLNWIRKNVPADQTVQTFPPARDWNVSIVPSFTGRAMVVGDRMHGTIFQIPPPRYRQLLQQLESLLRGLPESQSDLKRLGVDYLFWGEPESRYFKRTPRLKPVIAVNRTVLYALD